MLKSDFWDAVHLRYGLPLKRLSSHCGCYKPYNVQHAIPCKKGRFVTLRHNELRGNIAEMLEVSSDVKVDLALSRKKLKETSLTKLDLTLAPEHFGLEDREHSSTLQHLIPTLNVAKAKPCENVMKLTNKKKRENVEQGTFTPVMFSATRGTGRECPIIF